MSRLPTFVHWTLAVFTAPMILYFGVANWAKKQIVAEFGDFAGCVVTKGTAVVLF